MARLIRAIHFPEARTVLLHLWKKDAPHEGGHNENVWMETRRLYLGGPLSRAMTVMIV
jgi:hypothetical protein